MYYVLRKTLVGDKTLSLHALKPEISFSSQPLSVSTAGTLGFAIGW